MPTLTITIRCLMLALWLLFGTTAWAQQPPSPPITSETPQPAAPVMALAPAPDSDPYMVENVPVDVTATSAAAARDKAIFDGQRAALGQLLTRLGIEQSVDPAQISDGKMTQLVQDFEIVKEKSSTIRYIATLNVRFKPQAVQSLLNGAGYASSPPVVILPVGISNGRAVLWEERTAWRSACESLTRTGGLLPMIVPAGELNDVSAIGADDALAGHDRAMSAIAANYSAGSVLVAHIAVESGALDPAQPLSVTASRYDGNGVRLSTDMLTLPPATAVEAQLAAAAQAIDNLLRQYWKADLHLRQASVPGGSLGPMTAGQDGAQTSLPVSAQVKSAAELAGLKQRLDAVPGIRQAEVTSLRRGAVDMRLEFNGNIAEMQQTMTQKNLALIQSPDGVWQLQSH